MTPANMLWAPAAFPRHLNPYFLDGHREYVVVGRAYPGFEATERYLPVGACIAAIDGYTFEGRRSDVGRAITTYLFSRPRTDYLFIEYFPPSPGSQYCDRTRTQAVIFPMGQWTQAHRAWQARQQEAVGQQNANLARALVGVLTAAAVSALAMANRRDPDDSIVWGRDGCPMFTERHYDGMCW